MEPNYIGLSERIRETVDRFFFFFFPRFFGGEPSSFSGAGLEGKSRIEMDLAAQALTKALLYVLPREQAVHCVKQTMERMDQIRKMLQTDIQAAYEGDPAAISPDEVILCYPAFRAIVVYRIAHCLYILKVPIIPRMMTELAHSWTGIDIHPGATIGPSFFIDHGTGVVIGETCTIGSRVKLYQHVTLGSEELQGGGRRQPGEGHQTPPGHWQRRSDLRRRHGAGRRYEGGRRLRHRRQRLADPFHPARDRPDNQI